MIRCITPDCDRARVLARGGWTYPMCDAHTCEALRDAFGNPEPRAWAERARTHTLPVLAVGGIDLPAQSRSAPPRLDQAADLAGWAPGELVAAFGK